MQLSTVSTSLTSTVQPAGSLFPGSPGYPGTPPIQKAIADPIAPVAQENALDGVSRLFDFPGLKAGDAFDIVKGSKVGFFGVKGDANILRLEDNAAAFGVRAGAFGKKVDLTVEVARTGADTVMITSRGKGMPDQAAEGRILLSRTNRVEFAELDDPSKRTVISFDGRGRVTIDTAVPTFGNAHLVLDKRR